MAGRKSTTTDDARQLCDDDETFKRKAAVTASADRVAMLRQHDALTREIYGISLDELLTLARGQGLSAGYADGQRRGYTDGYEDAKHGKKSRRKSRRIKAETVIALTKGELGGWADVNLFMATASEVLNCLAAGNASRPSHSN
jgi:hypothetical protein